MSLTHHTRRRSGEPLASPTLVWIDAREARIVRWDGQDASIDRIESSVPEHRKATGLVRRHPRHDVGLMSGGYGHPHLSDDRHRLEHLARFLDDVSAKVPPDGPVHIIGPGPTRDHLERVILEADAHHHRVRTVTSQASLRLTSRQLVARMRALVGHVRPRRTVGAYRWTSPPDATGRPAKPGGVLPRRDLRKPADDRAQIQAAIAAAELEEATAEVAASYRPDAPGGTVNRGLARG